jgi:hypothetical protein
MSRWQEQQVYNQVNSRMAASEATRAVPPNEYGRDERYRCVQCGAFAVGGFVGDLANVQRQSSAIGVAIWGTMAGETRLMCGANCLRRHTQEVARGNGLPPFERHVEPAPAPSTAPATHAQRTVTLRCVRPACDTVLRIDQRFDGAAWRPDAELVTFVSGWTRAGHCSAFCAELEASRLGRLALEPGEVGPDGVKRLVAVEQVADASYQRARTRAQAARDNPPVPALIANREMPPTSPRGKGAR